MDSAMVAWLPSQRIVRIGCIETMVSYISQPKNKFGNMENLSYLYVDIEVLADRYEEIEELFYEINLVDYQ